MCPRSSLALPSKRSSMVRQHRCNTHLYLSQHPTRHVCRLAHDELLCARFATALEHQATSSTYQQDSRHLVKCPVCHDLHGECISSFLPTTCLTRTQALGLERHSLVTRADHPRRFTQWFPHGLRLDCGPARCCRRRRAVQLSSRGRRCHYGQFHVHIGDHIDMKLTHSYTACGLCGSTITPHALFRHCRC